jgi:sugar lactone lactonase YvrE
MDQEGMLLVLDDRYSAETLLTEKDGIASPDGLRWESGRLFIADEGGSALRVLEPGGKLVTLATGEQGLKSPEDMTRGPDGALWFTDDDAGGVWRFAKALDRAVAAEGRLATSEGLAFTPSGTLLVGGAGAVVAVKPGEGPQKLRLPIGKPESFAFDGAGNLYIADNEADILYLVTRDGRLHRPIQSREGFSPESLHMGASGLLITDSRHGKLHRFTAEDGLSTVAVFAGALSNVQGITSDEAGNLYVSVQSDLKNRRGSIIRLTPRKPR